MVAHRGFADAGVNHGIDFIADVNVGADDAFLGFAAAFFAEREREAAERLAAAL